MTITEQQIFFYMMNPYGSPKVFSMRSEHTIIREQLRKSIVASFELGIIHLN
jgi:hypothetical protein